MSEFLGQSSVLVPTRTTREEGFNIVCVEATLAGRPLVTSSVRPARHRVREAAIEARPGNVGDNTEALIELTQSRETFESKPAACEYLAAQFNDPANGWRAKVLEAISKVTTDRRSTSAA